MDQESSPSSPIKRRYNWRPDKEDTRDLSYEPPPRGLLPKKVDLRPLCSPVVNQGEIGSCTGNSIAGMLEFLELNEIRYKKNAPEIFGNAFLAFSRLFIYWNERALEGTTDQDAGAQIRDGIKSVSRWGICPEVVWQYRNSNLYIAPPQVAYGLAAKHRIQTYAKISNMNAAKTCLASGYPFVFGFTVFQSFESDEVAATGIVPLPTDSDQAVGGHAVMACGYDDKSQMVIVRNSWGPNWGDGGYFYIPYNYIFNQSLADDMWTVRR